MTDVYAERIMIEKFKELEGLIVTEDGVYPEVAFPNTNFERPDDGYWYELFFIPGHPIQIELGSEARSRWVGILQINICTPKDSGTEPINDRYESVSKLFRPGSNFDGVRITRCYRTSALENGDYYVMPVTVEFWADLDR